MVLLRLNMISTSISAAYSPCKTGPRSEQITSHLLKSHSGFGGHQGISQMTARAQEWMFCKLKQKEDDQSIYSKNHMIISNLQTEFFCPCLMVLDSHFQSKNPRERQTYHEMHWHVLLPRTSNMKPGNKSSVYSGEINQGAYRKKN